MSYFGFAGVVVGRDRPSHEVIQIVQPLSLEENVCDTGELARGLRTAHIQVFSDCRMRARKSGAHFIQYFLFSTIQDSCSAAVSNTGDAARGTRNPAGFCY